MSSVIPGKSWIDGGNLGFQKVFLQFTLRKQMRCLFCTGLTESFEVLFGSGTEWWREMHLITQKDFQGFPSTFNQYLSQKE
jgi:hypothetical protein